MSTAKPSHGPPSRVGKQDTPAGRPAPQFLPPLRPRPTLAILLGVILAGWIIALIAMWYVTVRPHPYSQIHQEAPAEQQDVRR